jgi:group I intron endonuclease
MTIGIYKFTNKINNKSYIGQSVNIEKRYNGHLSNYRNNNIKEFNTKFYYSIRKYGWDNYTFEIIEVIKDISLLNIREQYWINHYDSFHNGYNGNEGGVFITGRNDSHPMSILNNSEVEEIKFLLFNSNMTQKEISLKYNINQSTISNINTGKHWNTIGNYQYPIRISNYNHRKSFTSNKATFNAEEVLNIRKRYIAETIKEIYQDYKDRCSYITIERLLIGKSYKDIPIYHKKLKQWNKEPVSTIP